MPQLNLPQTYIGWSCPTNSVNLVRFVKTLDAQTFQNGGYFLTKLQLDSRIWMQVSRPRPPCKGLMACGGFDIDGQVSGIVGVG